MHTSCLHERQLPGMDFVIFLLHFFNSLLLLLWKHWDGVPEMKSFLQTMQQRDNPLLVQQEIVSLCD